MLAIKNNSTFFVYRLPAIYWSPYISKHKQGPCHNEPVVKRGPSTPGWTPTAGPQEQECVRVPALIHSSTAQLPGNLARERNFNSETEMYLSNTLQLVVFRYFCLLYILHFRDLLLVFLFIFYDLFMFLLHSTFQSKSREVLCK